MLLLMIKVACCRRSNNQGGGGRGRQATGKMQIDSMDLDTELADYMAARS